jgi:hypothetical protein
MWVEMSKPACQGQLFFAGEASSACHAYVSLKLSLFSANPSGRWVAGALDSAWVAVMSLLKIYKFPKEDIKAFLATWGKSEYFDPGPENEYVMLDIHIRLALWQAGFRQHDKKDNQKHED